MGGATELRKLTEATTADLFAQLRQALRTRFAPAGPWGDTMKIRSLLAACVAASFAVAVGPSAAQATCYSSTPTTQAFSDSIVDGDSGLAPEIGAISLTVDGSCHVTAGADLADRPYGLIQDD